MVISGRNVGDITRSTFFRVKQRAIWAPLPLLFVLAVACGQAAPTITPTTAPPPTKQPTPTTLNSAMGIIAPPPVATGTPRPQFWRLETAVRPEGSGTIEFSPEKPELLYFLGDTVELTAKCDIGFLRWAGKSSEGLDITANPVTVTVDSAFLLYALCETSP